MSGEEIDQTRAYQNNTELGRAVFVSILRNTPPLLQAAAVRQLLLDLLKFGDVHHEIAERYHRAHKELMG